jgi:hypothetical protein
MENHPFIAYLTFNHENVHLYGISQLAIFDPDGKYVSSWHSVAQVCVM